MIGCGFIFWPFATEILAATILVSIFYAPYEWLVKKFKGRRTLAAFVMCVLVSLLVVIPLANFIVFGANKAIDTYPDVIKIAKGSNIEGIINNEIVDRFNFLGLDKDIVGNVIIDVASKFRDWAVSGGSNLIKGTTNFFISFVFIVFTMFFFFADGKQMLERVMYWTPLPNKYDREIFKKFRDVSSSIVISTFLTAIAQGLMGAIGFAVVGLPVFFTAIAMAFFSLIPYVGTAIIWLPASIYLLVTGQVWQGVFLILWGAIIIGNIDNLLRAYLIKGKAQVHPIFIIFGILGGISLFGFWGVIFGPLIISLAITVLHIYEIEYEDVLEK